MRLASSYKKIFNNLEYITPFSRKIGYIGWLDHGNLGDDAMLYAFKNMFSGFKVLPFKYRSRVNRFEEISRKKIFDAVLLGGGTLINSGFIKDFKIAQEKYNLSFILGTGVQNPDFWNLVDPKKNCLDEWVKCLDRCSYVGVRGPLSRQLLDINGFHNAEIIGDPALSLAKEKITKKNQEKKIGINIGISNGNVWGKEETILDFIVELVKILDNKGWKTTFIPVWHRDIPYIEEAVRKINRNNISVFYNFSDVPGIMEVMESFDLFIGEKLHSVILAMCSYTPSIMLEYRPKCLDFMMSMGLERFNLRTDKLSFDLIINLINELYRDTESFQNTIFKKASYYKKLQKKRAENISKIITESA